MFETIEMRTHENIPISTHDFAFSWNIDAYGCCELWAICKRERSDRKTCKVIPRDTRIHEIVKRYTHL